MNILKCIRENVVIIIKIIAYILIIYMVLKTPNINEGFISTEKTSVFIPKIIHQTAPADKSKWNPKWFECQKTWKKHFPEPEYKHVMWTDEDIDNFMKNNFPEDYEAFRNYNRKIKKIDIVRYYILHKIGGIYADMDYKCFRNFYNLLPQDKVSIIRSPYPWEYVQNALMISPPGHPYWIDVIEESKLRRDINNVLKATGPILVGDVYLANLEKNYVNILPVDKWNPKRDVEESDDLITKHLGTYSWEVEAN